MSLIVSFGINFQRTNISHFVAMSPSGLRTINLSALASSCAFQDEGIAVRKQEAEFVVVEEGVPGAGGLRSDASLKTLDCRIYLEEGAWIGTAAGVNFALGQRAVGISTDALPFTALGSDIRHVFE